MEAQTALHTPPRVAGPHLHTRACTAHTTEGSGTLPAWTCRGISRDREVRQLALRDCLRAPDLIREVRPKKEDEVGE